MKKKVAGASSSGSKAAQASASRSNLPAPENPGHTAVTVLDHLIEHLRARDVALDGQERPAAILWTDPKGEWYPIVLAMVAGASSSGSASASPSGVGSSGHILEELLVLGDYAPETRTGPAIWIRCVVDKTLDEPRLPENRAPIIYLPEVARQELRAGDECRSELQPLVELMFRGALWHQPNGTDWTVTAFLTSTRTLGLEIARDSAAVEALLRALPEVAITPVAQLSGRRLQADDFDRMLAEDVVRDLLCWMGDSAGTKARLKGGRWEAFRNRCREEFDFDPQTAADVTAGKRLGLGEGPWKAAWERFVESPHSYGDIPGLLRRSRPKGTLPFDRSRWPDLNDEDEDAARRALANVADLPHSEACEAVLELERTHGSRRSSVWARLGQAPLAKVLEPLSRLAESARSALGGARPMDVAENYARRGWQADAASWEAIAMGGLANEGLIAEVVSHLIQPWLEDSARSFQSAVDREALPDSQNLKRIEALEDTCILFVDGLRYDLGQRLGEYLEGRGCRVTVNSRWAALPTVTATARPAVTPVAAAVTGNTLGEDFCPTMIDSGKPATAPNIRSAIEERGFQMIGSGQLDWPGSDEARGWAEAGQIDSLGHKLQGRLAYQLAGEIHRLGHRIMDLLNAGWKAVRVVTDHGWLLLPGGLPKVELPKHLTESRWSRCAVIAGESTPRVKLAPWHWNSSEYFATAPGIACFNRSDEYAHGGLSVQECLIPDILIERGGEEQISVSIKSVTWRGMRCFVEAKASGESVTADLRLDRPSGKSVAAAAKPVEQDGSVSLVLSDDAYETAQLVLVLHDADENVLAQLPTKVGENS